MKLQKYSIGMGDRFGCQAKAQIKAILKAEEKGLDIALVKNKSYREHLITETTPQDVLKEVQNAVKELNWKGKYYIDADHVSFNNVDLFIEACDFFTLDVADLIGKRASSEDIQKFIENILDYKGTIFIPILGEHLKIDKKQLNIFAEKYLCALKEAGRIYRKIELKKGKGNFIVEISMDESKYPQTLNEIFLILVAINNEKIPIQTFAPKFCGSLNKGIDYEGNLKEFKSQFESFLAIIRYCKEQFSLQDNLKLSIHSGSDKFTLYKIINTAIKKFDEGIHLKTSGTSWLEELIGLASVGSDGLAIVKDIYEKAYYRFEEMCEPYSELTNIKRDKLPHPDKVNIWTSENYIRALNHDSSCKEYNPHFRQFLHIAYKIAAEMKLYYTSLLEKYEEIINLHIVDNLYKRHIEKIFL